MEDPIYAAIDAHFYAWHAWNDASKIEYAFHHQDPGFAAAEQETERLSDITDDRLNVLIAAIAGHCRGRCRAP